MDTSTLVQMLALFAGSFLVTGVGIYFLLKTPAVGFFIDKPDARKIHRGPIPRLGGVVIVVSGILFLSAGLLLNLPLFVIHSLPFAVLFASAVILVTGFFDDTTFFTVRVRHKLLAEFSIAFAVVAVYGIHLGQISLFGVLTLPAWVGMVVSFLWVIGLANAYNIIDGLDGLAGTLALLAFVAIGIIAGITGNMAQVSVLVVLLAGAMGGFLLHNLPPAKTFMGDTGSIFIGTMVAILTLYIGKEAVASRAVIVLPLIAGVPILEVFVTMVRRYFKSRDKKKSQAACLHSMVIPDNSHIHHRLMYKGYNATQALILMVVLSFTLCCAAVVAVFIPTYTLPLLLLYLAVPVYFTLYQLGFGGRFKKALRISPTRYNGFRKQSLIGVIDTEGSFSEKLEKKTIDGVSCIKVSESDIPSLHQHLRAAVVREQAADPDTILKKAGGISWLLKGPVYVVDDTSSTELVIREVSKNGVLTVQEKTTSIEQLLKDFKRLGTVERIRHSCSTETLTEQKPFVVC